MYVHFLMEITMKESVVDVHLVKHPIFDNRNYKEGTNAYILGHQSKGLCIANALYLCVPSYINTSF